MGVKPATTGRPVSTHTLTRSGEKVSEEQVNEWLMELISGEESGYGYVLLTECLRRDHDLLINKKKVYRLCKKLGILHPQRRKKVHHPRKLARNHTITHSNQLWQLDVKYGYIAGYDQFFFIADMIDVFDRSIVGYHMGTSCTAQEICLAVEQALKRRVEPESPPPIIRTDNGPQFLSKLFGELCERHTIYHERIPPKTPNLNAYIESFHATLERDLLRKESYQTFAEAQLAVDTYMDFYNNRRMHHKLDKRSPADFIRWVNEAQPDLSRFYRAV